MKRVIVAPVWVMLMPMLVLLGALAVSSAYVLDLTARVERDRTSAEFCLPAAEACNTQLIQCLGYNERIADRIDRLRRVLFIGLGLEK